MSRTRHVLGWSCVRGSALLLLAAAACSEIDPCGVPGIVTVCACGNGEQGARVCSEDKHWGACDCSGAIALPGPIGPRDPQGGAGGTGGSTPAPGSGTGGAPVMPPDDDAGGEPQPQAGSGGTAGGADAGGAPADAGMPEPTDPYDNCATASDCRPGGECVITPSFPMDEVVCAPPCAQASDCPVPEGNFEAVLTCETGFCLLDCTPVLFAPLLSCPRQMTCIAPLIGQAYCHANGN